MLPARAYRTMVVPENADEPCELRVPCYTPQLSESDNYDEPVEEPTEPYLDAMDEAVYLADVRPGWHCDPCNQRNDGWRDVCGMCGTVRDDLDSCG